MWIMSCWVAHSVCCRFATQGPGMHCLGFWHIGDSNIYSNAMEMHLQECGLPADNGACVAAMTLKSQKTRPKFFQDFQSSNQHGTVVKSPLKKKRAFYGHGFRSGGSFMYWCIYMFIYSFVWSGLVWDMVWQILYVHAYVGICMCVCVCVPWCFYVCMHGCRHVSM